MKNIRKSKIEIKIERVLTRMVFMLIVLTISAGSALADLTNGGFEVDPEHTEIWYVTGWDFEGGGGTYGKTIRAYSPSWLNKHWWATEGFCLAYFNSAYSPSTVRLHQTIEVSAGDTLTFDYFWVSDDTYPAGDKVEGKILDSAGNTVSLLFSCSLTEDPASRWTEWESASFSFVSSGIYTLSLEIFNGGPVDNGGSYLGVDNVVLHTGPIVPPEADAGPDVSIYTEEQVSTTLDASGTHEIPDAPLQYRWLDGDAILRNWVRVPEDGSTDLSLAAPVPTFSVGDHILTLEVKYAAVITSDTMTLTILETPPPEMDLTNGGFEVDPEHTEIWYVTGWDFEGGGGTYGKTIRAYSPSWLNKHWWATEGFCLAYFNSAYSPSTVRLHQTIEVSAGDTLTFDYFWVSDDTYPAGDKVEGKILDSAGNTVSLLFSCSLTEDPASRWTEWESASFSFVSSGIYTLSLEIFNGGPVDNGGSYLGVDNVVLHTVVIPGGQANAGPDMSIYTSEQALTTIYGSGTHETPGTPLQYRWLEGDVVLQDWIDVGAEGAANLSLDAPVPTFSIGNHILTLEVTDAAGAVSDTMTLTVLNTPPGQDVEVSDPETGTTMLFDNVDSGGNTTVDVTQNGPDPPTGFKLVPLGMYYQIDTSAVFSGMVQIAIEYNDAGLTAGQEKALKLRVYEEGEWVNITTGLDTVNNIIYGETNHLSFFAITTRKLVEINIKPDSYPNVINLGSQGVIPVAILSSSDFDATTVNPDTVELAGSGVAVRGKGNKYLAHEEDVNGDGLLDLVCKVETENLDPDAFQYGFVDLTGQTYDDAFIVGEDEIIIVPPEE